MKKKILLKKLKREGTHVLLTVVAALFSVVALHTFVLPSNFASSGIDGICTVLFKITGLNMGWFKIMINFPLLVLACIFLNKKYSLYVILFTLLDSFGVILLEQINFYVYVPRTLPIQELIGYRLLAALAAGVLLGVCIGIMLRIGYSSGGIDIIAGLVHKWKPHLALERIISVCAYSVVGLSLFVYRDLTSVFLSVVQIFISERIVSAILKNGRYAIEVKIVTKDPEMIRNEILHTYKHGATVVKSNGVYSGDDNYILFMVINIKEIPGVMRILKKHPDTFVFFSDGVRVQGNFRFHGEEIGGWVAAFK